MIWEFPAKKETNQIGSAFVAVAGETAALTLLFFFLFSTHFKKRLITVSHILTLLSKMYTFAPIPSFHPSVHSPSTCNNSCSSFLGFDASSV